MAYVTVGTGVGVGLVVNAKPIHGLLHPEGGHLCVRQRQGDSFEGVCNFHGNQCIEGMVTNVAIAKRLGVSIDDLATLEDDNPVWDIVAYYLAQLCYSILLLASPHVIFLGGGVMNRKSLMARVHSHFQSLNNHYLVHPKTEQPSSYIRPPLLTNSGMVGAYLLDSPTEKTSPSFCVL